MAGKSHHPSAFCSEMLRPAIPRLGRNIILFAVVFTVCAAWTLLTRLHTASEPLDRDICTQILMGRVLADGGRLYVDTLEFKPPGMFVVWQVIHQLVGTARSVVLGTNILATTISLIGVFFAASARPWGLSGGLWAMVFWTLISGDMMLQANQPSNEVFVNLFMVWGIAFWVRADAALARRWPYIAAGLFLGCATLIKPVLTTVVCMGLGWLLAGGLTPGTLKRRARTIGLIFMPIAAGWTLMVLYFVCRGRGSELYDCLVRYAVFYAASQGGDAERNLPGIWLNILLGFSDKLYPSCTVFLAPLLGLTILGIAGAWLDGWRPQALTLAGCLLGTLFSVSIPGTYAPHYYQFYLPILAIGAGWGIAAVESSLRQRLLAWGIGLATIFLLMWHELPDLRFDADTWSRLKYKDPGGTFREVERCGLAVDQMLWAGESVYVWGNDPGVYYYSARHPASGIFWADRLMWGPLQKQATFKVLEDLKKNQPALIMIEDALPPPASHPVLQWIKQHYLLSQEARFSTLFTTYVRRDSPLASRLSNSPEPFALTLTDVNPDFLKQTADELLQNGRDCEAGLYLQKAVAITSSRPDIDNQLAWLLATSTHAGLRDGLRSVQLAKQACQFTDFKQPVYVSTLAAAYAENRQFEEAVRAAQKACALASQSGNPQIINENQVRLTLYRAHQPYREYPKPVPAKTDATSETDGR
jgi:hypothetical protein